MKHAKLVAGAVAIAALVLLVPEWIGPGPRADFGIGSRLATGALWAPLGLVFLGGLLTALTPCVYPLIPITVSVFGARQASSRGRALALTATYVAALALLFTGLGITAALTGRAFGTALGNPYVVGGLAVLLAGFALAMFGLYDFQLPSGLQTRLGGLGRAGFGGAFAMGLVAGLVAAPCTGPVLSGILVHVASTQNAGLGAALLLTYSLGLGLPFFLIGVFSVQLPKSGAWMDSVKSIFGIALLALAALYLRDAFPALRGLLSLRTVAYGALLAAGLVFVGVLVGAIHRSFHAWPLEGLLKGAGVVLTVIGLSMRPGAPLARPAEIHLPWQTNEPAALAQALSEGKPVLIDFGAEWCAACKELEKYVFVDERFAAEAARYVLVRVDATNEDEPEVRRLLQKYKVQGMPKVVMLDSRGVERTDATFEGFLDADQVAERMQRVR